jgi:hypothetical protein
LFFLLFLLFILFYFVVTGPANQQRMSDNGVQQPALLVNWSGDLGGEVSWDAPQEIFFGEEDLKFRSWKDLGVKPVKGGI